MLDHFTIKVRDLDAILPYYERVLGTLGYAKGVEFPGSVQFIDADGHPDTWLGQVDEGVELCPTHLAWQAKDTDQVKAFYEEALKGGTDNGAPGPRDYHPGYYACFVHDPEGNNIEAVLHNYEG